MQVWDLRTFHHVTSKPPLLSDHLSTRSAAILQWSNQQVTEWWSSRCRGHTALWCVEHFWSMGQIMSCHKQQQSSTVQLSSLRHAACNQCVAGPCLNVLYCFTKTGRRPPGGSWEGRAARWFVLSLLIRFNLTIYTVKCFMYSNLLARLCTFYSRSIFL